MVRVMCLTPRVTCVRVRVSSAVAPSEVRLLIHSIRISSKVSLKVSAKVSFEVLWRR